MRAGPAGAGGALSGRSVVRAGALLLVAAALTATAARGVTEPLVAVSFAALVTVGEAVRIRRPGGREQAPLGAAAGLAYALLGPLRGLPTQHGALQVVAVVGAGLLMGAVVRAAALALAGRLRGPAADRQASVPRPRRTPVGGHPHRGAPMPRARRGPPVRGQRGHRRRADRVARARSFDGDGAARRLLVVGFAALLFQPLYTSGALDRVPLAGPAYGVFLVLVAALAGLCDAVLAASQHQGGGRFGPALEEELRALPGIGSAIAATGMLVSLAAGEVGLWALPVFCLPLLLAQTSFRRAAAVRATYGQTIATLARATEVAGYTAPGHARRVADTACAVGRELGLGAHELALLEYAALMHDIGQLSLVEPVAAGATATLPEQEQQRIARLGSEVIRCTGVPEPVAEQVARSADPLLGPDGRTDRTLPLAARIIRVANAHEDLCGAADGSAGALAVLRAHCGRSFDPVVVAALERVRAQGRGPCTVARAEGG
ncbi:metal-dependent phosphohydrolase [Streptomyces tateyamensis]|uniref:Metal-dependent phosphohydrolase n=1 Tax=Streptomyces tateyamensis TaxID=565073 RepID=A0A2V4N7V8_9ACTN|nr:HD domain-containing phosphohydrolase [Streptomyces tateyamensis]PYC67048.1 metal-dependent phosphohydrolase [Streptomyces tateyamensis]